MNAQPYFDQKQANDSKAKNFAQDASEPSHDETYKKLAKLQKEYEGLLKEKNKLKEQLEQSRVALEENSERLSEMKRRLEEVAGEKSTH